MSGKGSKKAAQEGVIAVRLPRALLKRVADEVPAIQATTPHRVTQESAVHYLIELGIEALHERSKGS